MAQMKITDGSGKVIPKFAYLLEAVKKEPEETGSSASNLGYVNEWKGDVPEIVKECNEKKHSRWFEDLGRGHNKYGCDDCNYVYFADSTD